jgi:peptidoglycan/LPS O-acetylase OafA/YrhL
MRSDSSSARQAEPFAYRPAIDGLRGIAVLAVLGFHAFRDHVSGGFVGVDVFFVISGFLITGIIADQLRGERFSFADFYARRVRRLFPTLILVLAATLLVGWFVLLPGELTRLGKHIAATALFVGNIAFWRESGYFDVNAELKPLLHLWSLGVEEQFYLVWPALLVLLWKRKSVLQAVLWMLVLVSFLASIKLADVAPAAGFFLPVSRFWELGLGCILAMARLTPANAWLYDASRASVGRDVACNVVPAVGLILIGMSIFLFDSDTPFPSWQALLPVVGAALILATPEDAWFQRRVLAAPALVYVGLISYALYLWHWPLFSFATILQAGDLPNVTRWSVLLLSFALASLTYHFVEVPVRRRRSIETNVGLITAAAVAGAMGLTLYMTSGVPARFNVDVLALRHEERLDERCTERIENDNRINYCRTTSPRPPDVIVLGDSRAQAIYAGLVPLQVADSSSMMLLGRGGCPPLLNVRIRGYDLNERDCEDIWQTFVNYVHRVKPKVIVLVGNGSFLINRPDIRLSRVGAISPETKEAVFEHGLRALLFELTRTSQVIHIGEVPTYKTRPACFLRRVRLPDTGCSPDLDRRQVELSMSEYNRVLARLRESFRGVHFVNSVDILCTAVVCSQWPSGKPIMYSDEIHLSPAGAQLLVSHAGLPHLIAKEINMANAE